jgi:hypothetical protein
MNDRAIAGEFVTKTFDYDGSRQVTVYVPPALPEAEDVRQWIASRFGVALAAERTAVYGASAGGDAGADVVMKERAGSHGGAFWRKEFPLMVAWVFGREITF